MRLFAIPSQMSELSFVSGQRAQFYATFWTKSPKYDLDVLIVCHRQHDYLLVSHHKTS